MASRITVAEILARNAERVAREEHLPIAYDARPGRTYRAATAAAAIDADFDDEGFDVDDLSDSRVSRVPSLSPLSSLSLYESGSRSMTADVMRANATILVDKLRFARTVFEQYEGRRDFAKVLGYKKQIDFDQYVDQYERGDVAQRIVDIPAEETWFGFPEVVDADGRNGEFAKAWKRLAARLNLPEAFCRLDRGAGIGHYGCALVGLAGQSLASPITPVSAPEDVLYISVFTEGSAKLGPTQLKRDDPLYGKPESYFLDLGTSDADSSKGVHPSRILHLAEGRLESDLYGIPRLKPVFNRLFDMAKVIGGSAETFWLVANKGLHANIDPTKARGLKKGSLDKLGEDLEKYRDQMTRVLRTYGVDIKDLGSDVVNPRGVFAVIAAVIAGASRIPIRMLYPETRGAATSINDRVAFREEVVLPRQKRVAEPQVVRPFVNMMVTIGAMPPPKQSPDSDFIDFGVIWPDPVSRSKVDQVEIGLKRSVAVWNLAKARQAAAIGGGSGVLLSTKQEMEILGFDNAPEASDTPPPAPPDVTHPDDTTTNPPPDGQPDTTPPVGAPPATPATLPGSAPKAKLKPKSKLVKKPVAIPA